MRWRAQPFNLRASKPLASFPAADSRSVPGLGECGCQMATVRHRERTSRAQRLRQAPLQDDGQHRSGQNAQCRRAGDFADDVTKRVPRPSQTIKTLCAFFVAADIANRHWAQGSCHREFHHSLAAAFAWKREREFGMLTICGIFNATRDQVFGQSFLGRQHDHATIHVALVGTSDADRASKARAERS